MLERIAGANAEKIRIVKVDANANRDWAVNESLRGVPTLQFYQGGKKIHEFAGAYPEKEIQKKIDLYAVATTVAVGPDGTPAPEPAIRPMPKDWLPPGVSRK